MVKDTIQDMAHQLFFDICEKKPTDIDMFFLDQVYFPRIEYEPRMTVYIPMPREVQGLQVLQGNAFTNIERSQETIFALYFASVCHAAGHAKLTDIKKYKKWMKGKNKKRALETFEYMEDVRVDDFLKNNFPEYYSEIEKIKEFYNLLNKKEDAKNAEKHSKKIFSQKFVTDIKIQRENLRKRILELDLNDEKAFVTTLRSLFSLMWKKSHHIDETDAESLLGSEITYEHRLREIEQEKLILNYLQEHFQILDKNGGIKK